MTTNKIIEICTNTPIMSIVVHNLGVEYRPVIWTLKRNLNASVLELNEAHRKWREGQLSKPWLIVKLPDPKVMADRATIKDLLLSGYRVLFALRSPLESSPAIHALVGAEMTVRWTVHRAIP